MNRHYSPTPKGLRSIPRSCNNPSCGKIFYTTQNYIKNNAGKKRASFCSRQCAIFPLLIFRAGISSGVDPLIRRKAIYVAGQAVRKGLLTPQACERCGSEERVEKHHESYAESDFTKIHWLCKKCHDVLHFVVIPQTLEIKKRFFKI